MKLYPPNIHLFAYSFKDYNSDENVSNSDWLWDKCNNIIRRNLGYELFKVQDFIQEKELSFNLIKPPSNQDIPSFCTIKRRKRIVNDSQNKNYTLSVNKSRQRIEIIALKIKDIYTLVLSIYPISESRLDALTIRNLGKFNFNRNGCLLLKEEGSPFLGQNIFISAVVQRRYKNKPLEWLKTNIADQYIDTLFNESDNKPLFCKAGKLLGRPIFEYSAFKQLDKYHNIYVWLVNDKDEKYYLQKGIYYHFIELFSHKSQVIYAYKKFKDISIGIKNRNLNIENFIKVIIQKTSNQKYFNKLELESLNEQLLELTQMSLEYVNSLKQIESWRNYLVEYNELYLEKIEEINRIYLDKIGKYKSYSTFEEVDFLFDFGVNECIFFEKKVTEELNFFQHKFKFLDSIGDGFSNLIREIERKREYTEREKDRNQNIVIFAAASGLGAAEVIGSNFKEIKKDNLFKNLPIINQRFIENYPFASVIIYSFGFSIFVGATLLWSWISLKFAFRVLLVSINAIQIKDIKIENGKIIIKRRRTKETDSLLKEIMTRIKYL